MARYTRIPSRAHLRRALQCITVLALGACTDSCDDPTGPDYQYALAGVVTLNGEPLPGIRVAAGITGQITDANGRYNMRVQTDSNPLIGCLSVTTPPYDAVTPPDLPSCFTLYSGDAFNFDWNYVQVLPIIEVLTPQEGALIQSGSTIGLNSLLSSQVSVNGRAPFAPPVARNWTSSLDGDLGPEIALFSVNLSDGIHVLTVSFTDPLGATATDQVTVTVGSGNQPPVATIVSPAANATYSTADLIQFSGTGIDPEDGTLTGSALTWSTPIEGTFGTGESFTRQLPVGRHSIRLVAMDSGGGQGEATVLIDVLAASGTGVIQGSLIYLGSPLANVTVTLTGATTLSTTTDAQGAYSFMNLPSGAYTVTISPPPGTDIVMSQQVGLEPGQVRTVNFTG